jgi:chromosome partitioning protein
MIDNPRDSDFLLTASELSDLFNVTPQAIYLKMKTEKIGFRDPDKGYVLTPNEVRDALIKRHYTYQHQVISFQCCKGGVGKTSIAHGLAIRSNMYGSKVLCIDLDMQAHLTLAFTTQNNRSKLVGDDIPVWSDLLNNNVESIHDLIVPITKTFHIIPSSLENSTLEFTLTNNNRKINLSKAVSLHLEKVKDHYDYIIIDCAPGFSGINTAATCASDLIIIPASPDRFGIDGVEKTISELKEIKSAYNLNTAIKVILNRYDARKNLSVTQLLKLQSQFPEQLLPCYVRESSEIPNAIDKSISVFEMPRKKTPAKEDLDILTREVMGLRGSNG